MSEPTSHPMPSADLPPLRIHHFLVWMAVLAATVAFQKLVGSGSYQSHAISISFVAETILQTLCVTVAGVVVTWRWRKAPLFTEPGHGMLLLECGGLAWFVANGLVSIGRNSFGWSVHDSSTLVRLYLDWNWTVWEGVQALVAFGCSVWIARAYRWRLCFLIIGIAFALQGIIAVIWIELLPDWYWSLWSDCSILIYAYLPGILGGLIAIAAIAMDYRNRIHHHWSHWCGVVSFLLNSLISIVTKVSELLSSPTLYSVPPQLPTTTF